MFILLLKSILLLIIYQLIQARCPNYCSGHGKCRTNAICECYTGWGADTDIADYKSSDCSTRVCQNGKSWGSVPTYSGDGHSEILECSGIGTCDRNSGQCKCPTTYTGKACERRKCPNDCSGHGRCYSMRRLAQLNSAFPLTNSNNVTYGLSPEYNVSLQIFHNIFL